MLLKNLCNRCMHAFNGAGSGSHCAFGYLISALITRKGHGGQNPGETAVLPIPLKNVLVDPLHFLLNQVSRNFAMIINIRAADNGRLDQLKAALSNKPYSINIEAKLLRFNKKDPSEAMTSVRQFAVFEVLIMCKQLLPCHTLHAYCCPCILTPVLLACCCPYLCLASVLLPCPTCFTCVLLPLPLPCMCAAEPSSASTP